MSTTTENIEIPLNKLALWAGNVRRTGAETGLDELAASIEAHGLLNPLTVRKGPKGKFSVVAGQRRYLALKRLAEAGTIPKAAPVSCTLRDAAEDGEELSLAENVVRVAMHPADQFEAWRSLIDKGHDVPHIAARFGVAETTVRKRLALSRVSPRIFGLYREGTIDLEALQAFTVTDDHALQEAVWTGMVDRQWHDARSIRHALTQAAVPCCDKRARFVGLEAYQAAGGTIRRDLFDPEEGGFLEDAALLDRLTREKLDAIAVEVKAEGWQWAEGRMSFGWTERQDYAQAEPIQTVLSDDLQAEAEALEAEADELADDEDAAERWSAINDRLQEIEAQAFVWTPELKAATGAVVYLTHDGTPEIVRGLMTEEEAASRMLGDDEDGAVEKEEAASEAAPALPASLIEDLTAHKTAALRIELARSPDVALALVVHAMASSAFHRGGASALKASMTSRSLKRSMQDHDACPAVMAMEAERERIGDMLPANTDDLWHWCRNASQADLLDMLAVAAAHGIDAVATKSDPNRSGVEGGNALAEALKLDMGQWYAPTAAGYFSRIGKAAILADLAAARRVRARTHGRR